MKVRMLCNPARSYGCELKEGETGNVSDELGDALLKAGIAELIAPKKGKEIKAVEPEPIPVVKPAGSDKDLQHRMGLPKEPQPSTSEK